MAEYSNLIVPGRLIYGALFTPSRWKSQKGEDQWTARILFPKSEKALLQQVAKEILNNERAQSIFGKSLRFRKGTVEIDGISSSDHQPIKDGDRINQADHKGHWYLQAKSTKPPLVVDQRRQKILEPGIIYDGCFCNFGVAVKSYPKAGGSPAAGISWFLNAVQLVRNGPQIQSGPAAEYIFDEIEIDESEMPEFDEGALDFEDDMEEERDLVG